MGSRTATPEEPSSPGDSNIRKRVCKACDRCRLKKSKCDGSSPCSRCRADNAICVFGERKKSQDKVYPKGYVEMLENQQTQLVAGLQELYRRLQNGEGWIGSPLKESTRGMPLTHDILERLGALKTDSKHGMDHFEDNYENLQHMLFANGAPAMPREESFETNSESEHSLSFDMPPTRARMASYPHSFAGYQFPPTPPVTSPFPHTIKTSSPLKAEMSISTSTIVPQEQWQADPLDFTEMDYNMTYDATMNEMQIQAMAFTHQAYPNTSGSAINPCLTMKQWPAQDELTQRYYGSSFT